VPDATIYRLCPAASTHAHWEEQTAMWNLIRRAAVLAGAAALILGAGMGVAAAQPLPNLVITPNPGDYGNVPAGEAAVQVFTLANTGGSATGALTVTASPSPPFTITASTCRGALGPGMSCTVTVTFAPTTAAAVTGTLTAAGTRPEAKATAGLSGTGTGQTAVCQVTNTTTSGGPYTSLQAAVTAAGPGDELSVTGTCDGPTTIGKNLTITGNNGAILNGEEQGSVLVISSAHLDVALNALIITNGSSRFGSGIDNLSGAVTLNGSTVIGNTASNSGGGIYTQIGASVTLNNSTVTGNTAERQGGGIYTLSGMVTLNNSTVTGNTAGGEGGGIFTLRCTDLTGAVAGENVRDNFAPLGPNIYSLTPAGSDCLSP